MAARGEVATRHIQRRCIQRTTLEPSFLPFTQFSFAQKMRRKPRCVKKQAEKDFKKKLNLFKYIGAFCALGFRLSAPALFQLSQSSVT